ncbi:hypothetical protein Q7L29_21590 [Pseudomonas putida]|uniref:hypothetical protein n=1 Tax=Pseudomonas putida TaxID=303 RepID=UPI0027642B33|nr:hypothetical protein [Pseudomonas putida]MDP9541119.1 hypothetical protein [Pseudomonas putida]
MLLTHPSAQKKSLLSDTRFHEWRFVIIGNNCSWIHLTQTISKNGQPVESKTLIVSETSELHNMHLNVNADVRYEEAYLITPAHVNQSWGSNQSLLKQIDRVVEHTDDHINVYHIFTVDFDTKLWSSAPLDKPNSRVVTTIYKAPEEVMRRAEVQEDMCRIRRLEILRRATKLHNGDSELGFIWAFENIEDIEGRRPIDMTADQQFEKLNAYINKLLNKIEAKG